MWKQLLTGFSFLQSLLATIQDSFVEREIVPQDVATNRIITGEFSAFADEARRLHGVRGLSLGIVKADGSVEFGGWGNSTETGDPVDEDVSVIFSRL